MNRKQISFLLKMMMKVEEVQNRHKANIHLKRLVEDHGLTLKDTEEIYQGLQSKLNK